MESIQRVTTCEDGSTVKLDRSMLKNIDLDKFIPSRVHFLVHALQYQNKLPS